MPRQTIALLSCVAAVTPLFCALAAKDAKSSERALYSPPPEYPSIARKKHLEGSGFFRLVIDKESGAVARVDTVRTTGHEILDQAAISAFRKWRFQPHHLEAAQVPINFSSDVGVMDTIDGVDRESYANKKVSAEDEATKSKVYAIAHPPPEYPMWARERLVTGTGTCRLVVDYGTGAVTKVVRLESTGSEKLDAAGVKAFQQWRFPPKTTRAVKIPLTFTLEGGPFSEDLQEARKFATFSPTPTFPTAARFENLQSWGTYQFLIDYETGRVIDVKILKTSGSGILDKPIVRTFRTWRFRPHTVRTVTTNFGFMFDRGGSGNAG
jgi:TonB family protein